MTLQAQNDTLITVFGGSGFLGRHLVRALAKRHYRIRVAVRRPDLAGHLQPLGRVGQIHAVQANVRHPARSRPRCATPTSSSTWSASCSSAAGSASTPCRRSAPSRWRSPPPPMARG